MVPLLPEADVGQGQHHDRPGRPGRLCGGYVLALPDRHHLAVLAGQRAAGEPLCPLPHEKLRLKRCGYGLGPPIEAVRQNTGVPPLGV